MACKKEESAKINHTSEAFGRYTSEVFQSASLWEGISYQANSIEDLEMNIYEPAEDTAASRRLIIMDRHSEEMAKSFARKGFVVALLETEVEEAIRFFHEDVNTINLFMIDTNSIVLHEFPRQQHFIIDNLEPNNSYSIEAADALALHIEM